MEKSLNQPRIEVESGDFSKSQSFYTRQELGIFSSPKASLERLLGIFQSPKASIEAAQEKWRNMTKYEGQMKKYEENMKEYM